MGKTLEYSSGNNLENNMDAIFKQHAQKKLRTTPDSWKPLDALWKHHAQKLAKKKFLKRFGKQLNMTATCANNCKNTGSLYWTESDVGATWKQNKTRGTPVAGNNSENRMGAEWLPRAQTGGKRQVPETLREPLRKNPQKKNTRVLKTFGKHDGRSTKATCTKTWDHFFLKGISTQCERNTHWHLGKHQVLEKFGKQHGCNMKAPCANTWKHQVPEALGKAISTQHEINMRKATENTGFLKILGKQHGCNMKVIYARTWENSLKPSKATWTQHGRNTDEKRGKHQVLEAFWKARWTPYESDPDEYTKLLKGFGKHDGHNL